MARTQLTQRPSWRFFVTMTRAVPGLSAVWWALLALRSLLPAALAVCTGWLVGAVAAGSDLTTPLTAFGILFVAAQVAPPLHQVIGTLLGHRLSNELNERLLTATLEPDGIGHLERGDLSNDLTTARDFDLGMTGPPMFINMDFVAGSVVLLLAGVASALVLFGYSWWAPLLLLAAWGSTHWLLRESGVWRDRNTDEVKSARRHTDYAYTLATEPAAAKEVRLFGFDDWLLERFRTNRLRLHELQYAATRLRERSLLGALVIVLCANGFLLFMIARDAYGGALTLQQTVTFAGAAFGASLIAFGGLSWAMDVASAPVMALEALEPEMHAAGSLVTPAPRPGDRSPPPRRGAPEIRFEKVTFAYPGTDRPVLRDFDLTIPAGSSFAIVGINGAGKTTIAKLLCRLYDPQAGAIRIDGVDLRELPIAPWRSELAAVFQDFVRYELPLRDNVMPLGGEDAAASAALAAAGADRLAGLDTPMAKGYPGGIDVSGGQWQRIALARAIAKVEAGADVVLLDEPTAMLDVRGEAEIFSRVLDATAHATTILISHRFSTVRQVDHICVVEEGRAVEVGSHDELVALGGRYRTMYDVQASRFVELDDEGEEVVYESL